MTGTVEKDDVTGLDTTGHEWDGIKELDRPLPRWWVYVFYACIAWAVVLVILYPAIPWGSSHSKGLLGWTSRGQFSEAMATAKAAQAKYLKQIAIMSPEKIAANKDLRTFALAGGKTAFLNNCAPCHGAGGAGAKGFPNLDDDDWLWGGTFKAIHQTVTYGVRAGNDDTRTSEMPKFGADGILTPQQISDVAEYVMSLSKTSKDAKAAALGAPIFQENCAACHGDKGQGTQELGAPRLNDAIWLYGGDKATIVETITNARAGVMPAWGTRLSGVVIKMLTVYVHSLGGGQ